MPIIILIEDWATEWAYSHPGLYDTGSNGYWTGIWVPNSDGPFLGLVLWACWVPAFLFGLTSRVATSTTL